MILTTDASEHAVAAILSPIGHPIIYLSRKLTSAEANYSNMEKEALAIVWSTGLVSLFNGISTFVGYLMPKLFS